MRRITGIAFVALVASACMSSGPEASVREDAIVNGTRETGYPEVVALYWSAGAAGGGLCTGTVIGPYAVLTAKHCVFEELSSGAHRAVPANDMIVIVGHDLDAAGGITSTHRVLEVRTTPGSDVNSDVEAGRDIALLLLDSSIGVTARGTATSGPSAGNAVTIVGFGRTGASADSAGAKHRGSTVVRRVGDFLIETDGSSWTCQGDSGGPLFDPAGNVAGITSFGIGDCTNGLSYFTRVAAHRTLINGALAFVPPCRPMAETCNGVDDDCNGEIDDLGCASPGDPCVSSDDCALGSCEDVAGEMICALSCFTDDPTADCSADQHCEPTGCGIGRCIAGAPGAGADGVECASGLECASGYCATFGGTARCATQCMLEAPGCGGGEICEPIDDACGGCIPMELSTRPRPFGAECGDDAVCESADCGAEGFCTRTCAAHAECGDGFHCAGGVCARRAPAPEGGACGGDDDCADSLACAEGVCRAGGGGSTGGGCAVSGREPAGAWLAVMALVGLAAARRRSFVARR